MVYLRIRNTHLMTLTLPKVSIKTIRITQLVLAFMALNLMKFILGGEHPLRNFLIFVAIAVSLEVSVWYKKSKGEVDPRANKRTYILVSIAAYFITMFFA